jgi:hypothetical protein
MMAEGHRRRRRVIDGREHGADPETGRARFATINPCIGCRLPAEVMVLSEVDYETASSWAQGE